MARPSGNRTSGKVIEAAERVVRALELRKAGCEYRVIAEQCGYKNAQRAHEAVQRAIRALPRPEATDVRQLELERLDRLFLGVWSRAIKGDEKAIERALSIMKRRAAYLSLDAPTRIEQVGTTTLRWDDDEKDDDGRGDGGAPDQDAAPAPGPG